MPEPLTDRQRAVLAFIRQHLEKTGIYPTVREVASHFGFASPLSAQLHLNALVRKGYIERMAGKNRGMRIIGLDAASGRSLPLLGRVRAGRPILAVEEADAQIAVDRHLFRARDAFALKVTGDSMIEDGIFEGDIVVVKPEKEPADGSIAVVLVGDEVTVKRIFREKKTVRLVPANRSMKPVSLHPRELQVLGRVIGLVRRI